ncbi:MAG: ATP-binding protein [Roseburia sp.]|nr:ATP-binding protein [Roseburia sp.]
MPRTVSIGEQDFEELIRENCFYVDKTNFIKEWWESKDKVTLITCPRRFGKTLNMSMLERFFSLKYAKDGTVFEHLAIWEDENMRKLQGTYPVISLSFAGVKETGYDTAVYQICEFLQELYIKNYFLLESNVLTEGERERYKKMADEMKPQDAPMALHLLSDYLCRYYGKKVIILLDEYDTPLQKVHLGGYWKEAGFFVRRLFHNTFKTNAYMERAVMTGITGACKEYVASDLNISMAYERYVTYFGFTEQEVFKAMDEFELTNREEVTQWYGGFTAGNRKDIYNPWSIISYLDKKQLKPYWANASAGSLASRLVREGSKDIKMQFELLLTGRTIRSRINEEMSLTQYSGSERSVWSLLLAAGYLKVTGIHGKEYELSLTNGEVRQAFEDMVHDWFDPCASDYNEFIKSLLRGNKKEMNIYMNRVVLGMFGSFADGINPSESVMPEKFYHGFVLVLLVDLMDRYEVKSNRESGYGRYDVLLHPRWTGDDGIILEFKVWDPKEEASLEDTVKAALKQIEERRYEQMFPEQGLEKGRIRKYGIAFRGKEALIG